ncbi:MAG: hypothetical protein JKY65_23620 [Planctomycetes bacterium]|nr:hypothetical protein [Planctomycetota bacterium]
MARVPVPAALAASALCFVLGASVGVGGVGERSWESATPNSSGGSRPELASNRSSSRVSSTSPSQAITPPPHSAQSLADAPLRETTSSRYPSKGKSKGEGEDEGKGATPILIEVALDLDSYFGRTVIRDLVHYWVERDELGRASALLERMIAHAPAELRPYGWLLKLNPRAAEIHVLRAIDLGKIQLLEIVTSIYSDNFLEEHVGQSLRQELLRRVLSLSDLSEGLRLKFLLLLDSSAALSRYLESRPSLAEFPDVQAALAKEAIEVGQRELGLRLAFEASRPHDDSPLLIAQDSAELAKLEALHATRRNHLPVTISLIQSYLRLDQADRVLSLLGRDRDLLSPNELMSAARSLADAEYIFREEKGPQTAERLELAWALAELSLRQAPFGSLYEEGAYIHSEKFLALFAELSRVDSRLVGAWRSGVSLALEYVAQEAPLRLPALLAKHGGGLKADDLDTVLRPLTGTKPASSVLLAAHTVARGIDPELRPLSDFVE